MRDDIDRSNWLKNDSGICRVRGWKEADHTLRTRSTETSIMSGNCVLNLDSASHGLQKLREYVLYHTENYLRYNMIKHLNMIITYQSSVAVRNIFTSSSQQAL